MTEQELNSCIDKIDSYKLLDKGWNGYDGEKICENVINSAKSVLSKIRLAPQISPTGRGTIQFDFNLENGIMEVEVGVFKSTVFESRGSEDAEYKVANKVLHEFINIFIEP